MRVLVVEDDDKTACALAHGLASAGLPAAIARTGEEVFFLLNTQTFDLIVLDWMLPGRPGLDVLRMIRAGGSNIPVVLLTARSSVEDRVVGLENGADDYMVKPFAIAELVARIRTLLRRIPQSEPPKIMIEDLVVDPGRREVVRARRVVKLTLREFELLAYLARHSGQIVTRDMLAEHVWHETNRLTPFDNIIDVHVAHLRKKIDGGHAVKLIQTVRGVGFVLGPT